ncbi:MAG: PAS domain S-box protein [Leptospiraceae bacterium]|nr:PAS domain S-box protein [Leptospiraceae bacterium]
MHENLEISGNIIESFHDPFFIVDLDFRIITGNKKFLDNSVLLTGYELKIGDFLFKDEESNSILNNWKINIHKIFRQESGSFNFHLLGDKTFEIYLNSYLIEGEIKGCCISVKEISDILQLNKNYLSNENLFNLIYDFIPLGVVVQDKEGKIIQHNSIANKILGLDKKELSSRDSYSKEWRSIKEDGSDFRGEEHPSMKVLKTNKPVKKVKMGIFNPQKNSTVWLEIDSFPIFEINSGNLDKVFTIFNDITDTYLKEVKVFSALKEMQNALHNLNQLQDAISEHAIVAITDKRGIIEYVNQKFLDISKFSKEELIGKTHKIINSGFHSKKFFENLNTTIHSGKIWKGLIKNKTKTGEFYWVDTTIVPIFTEIGVIDKFISIRTDVTENINNLENLKIAFEDLNNQNLTKEKLLKIISHDLRSPFSGIDGLIELLLENEELLNNKEKVKKILNLISYSSKNTFELLEDLLTWSVIHSKEIKYKPEFYYLEESFSKIKNLYSGVIFFKNIKLNLINSVSERVLFDKDMLETVVRNIIMNSIKFTNEGGEIKVRLDYIDEKIVITIEDNGVGMSEEVRASLFNKGENLSTLGTKKEKGRGVGLLICQEFIDYQNGDITVKSEKGKGSIFKIQIPSKKES